MSPAPLRAWVPPQHLCPQRRLCRTCLKDCPRTTTDPSTSTEVAFARPLDFGQQDIHVVRRGQPTDVRLNAWTSAKRRLSVHQREEMLLGLHHGMPVRAIAQALGPAPSMVTRKLAGNGGRGSYCLWPSHQRVRIGTKRPNVAELYNSAWS
jgi:hypothetical protein